MTKREEAITAISRAILGRTCTVAAPAAFDAVVKVLMEPSREMLEAGSCAEISEIDGVGQEYPMLQSLTNEDAANVFQAMLKEAAK